MTLPQLPTDNLYKFMFLAGITIMGASSFLYIDKYNEIQTSLDSIEMDVVNSKLAFYKDSINIRYDLAIIDQLQKEDSISISKLKQSGINLNKIGTPEIAGIEANLESTNNKLIKAKRRLLDSKISDHITSESIAYKLKKIRQKTTFLIWVSIFCGVSFILGFIISKHGYNLWQSKVQKPNDQKLAMELKKLISEEVK